MISKLRRKINDSNIGQKVNGSIPGILVEGASRGIADGLAASVDLVLASIHTGGAVVLNRIKKPELAAQFVEMSALHYGLALLKPTHEDLETHYSHKSRLYRHTAIKKGLRKEQSVMERIPTTDAILSKLEEGSLTKAAYTRLDLLSNRKVGVYRPPNWWHQKGKK